MNTIHLNIDQNTEVGKAFLQMIRSTAKLYKEIVITEDFTKDEKKLLDNIHTAIQEENDIRSGKKKAIPLDTFLNRL